jgi:drug/metabolite transporter (DMT)-like permease
MWSGKRGHRPVSDTASQRRTGVVLLVAAAVAWSTAPFFTRLLPLDSWTIIFWRGVFGGAFIAVALLAVRGRAGLQDFRGMDSIAWLVASLSTLGMIAFIPALQLTSVSNVAIIIATGPFATAALAWIWLRERPRWQTLVAMAVAFCGIAIIVGGAGGRADIIGIALACFMMSVIAAMTVVVRRHKGTSMVAAAALSNFLGSIVSVPFADGIAAVTLAQLLTLAMFGVFQVGLGLSLFMLGSRFLPSGQAALIGTIETPLMPFWIWLAFQEIPTARALIGGAIVMAAVVADIVGETRSQRQAE